MACQKNAKFQLLHYCYIRSESQADKLALGGHTVRCKESTWDSELQEVCLHVLKHECWCVELKHSIYSTISQICCLLKKGVDRIVNFFPICLHTQFQHPNLVNVARLLLWHEKRNSEPIPKVVLSQLKLRLPPPGALIFGCPNKFRLRLIVLLLLLRLPLQTLLEQQNQSRVPWYWDSHGRSQGQTKMRTWYDSWYIDMIFNIYMVIIYYPTAIVCCSLMLNGEWYVDIFVESKAQMSIAAVSSICCRAIFSWLFQVESAAIWAEGLFPTCPVPPCPGCTSRPKLQASAGLHISREKSATKSKISHVSFC